MFERLITVSAEKRCARSTASLSVEKPGFHPAAIMIRPANTETAVGSVTRSSMQWRLKMRRSSSPLTRVAAMPTQSWSSLEASGEVSRSAAW
jgi:hypothetical protein